MDLDSYIGIIKNQIWIYSKHLPQKNLTKIIKKNYNFKILTYQKAYGLLIEYDETNTQQLEYIQIIKNTTNIDNVYNRVYEGINSFEPMKFDTINLQEETK